MSIEEILKELTSYAGKFPEAVVQAAIAQREAITPRLLAILEEVAANGAEVARREGYILHIYALYLLAQFREKKAFPLAIKLISQPNHVAEDLLGDTVAEGLASILASVFDGNLEALIQLVLQKDANPFVRSSATDTITSLFIEGIISREAMLGAFGRLFKELNANDDPQAWNGLVSSVADAQAREFLPEVRLAFEKGLVEENYMGFEDVEELWAKDSQKVFADFKQHNHLVTDVVAEMGWWACFHTIETSAPKQAVASKTTAAKAAFPGVGRNDPCPCGSGKKYKKCCLK